MLFSFIANFILWILCKIVNFFFFLSRFFFCFVFGKLFLQISLFSMHHHSNITNVISLFAEDQFCRSLGFSGSAEEGEFSEKFQDEAAETVVVVSGGGINGKIKPPPETRVPVVDNNTCSTWDLLKELAPTGEGEEGLLNWEGVKKEDKDVGNGWVSLKRDNAAWIAEIVAGLSESSSFSASNEDDSSSTATEPSSNNVSPNGRVKRIITPGCWQKGEFLGGGSFGSVYEGISDDGFFFAVKEVSLLHQGDRGKQSVSQLEQEIALLSRFKHDNIVQYYGTERVVKGKNKGYGLPADIWSLGCTVLEMLMGQIPYSNLECMQAIFRIGKGERPHIPGFLSRDAKDFIMQCLQVNPDDRPTAAQLLNHPFLQRPLSQSSSPYIHGR